MCIQGLMYGGIELAKVMYVVVGQVEEFYAHLAMAGIMQTLQWHSSWLLIVSFVTEHDEIFLIYASRARAQTVEAILIRHADGKQPGEG
jgi:hypothetical protein